MGTHRAIAWFQIKRGWVRVGLLSDKPTRDPYSQKQHFEISNILKFGVYRANIERDTAIQKTPKFTTKSVIGS